MDIWKKIQNLIDNDADNFISFISQYSEKCPIRYDFNISSHNNNTFFTIRPHLVGTSYVVLLKIRENNKDFYIVPLLPVGDNLYKSLISNIIETYENCIENNYFS